VPKKLLLQELLLRLTIVILIVNNGMLTFFENGLNKFSQKLIDLGALFGKIRLKLIIKIVCVIVNTVCVLKAYQKCPLLGPRIAQFLSENNILLVQLIKETKIQI
jgi:ABC-type sulfate transport system permease subunit